LLVPEASIPWGNEAEIFIIAISGGKINFFGILGGRKNFFDVKLRKFQLMTKKGHHFRE